MDKFLEFTSNHVLLVSALMISFFLVVFTELRRKAGGLVNVEASDAVKLINNAAVVVDIRSADAFARGHIVNAKNIPADELDGKIEQLQKYKAKPIVAVCDSGVTTTRVVNTLRKAGFESVFGQIKYGFKVHPNHFVPLFFSHPQHQIVPGDAGIIHHDI